jgi:hypothetical protein
MEVRVWTSNKRDAVDKLDLLFKKKEGCNRIGGGDFIVEVTAVFNKIISLNYLMTKSVN